MKNSNIINDIGGFIRKTADLVFFLIPKKTKSGNWVLSLGLAIIIIVLLIASIIFVIVPTSIFGEASDLNHDQRDEAIISVSSDNNSNIAVTNEGLIKTINAYRDAWASVELENSTSDSLDPSIDPVGIITTAEFNIICAIVQGEGGDSYDDALAVITCVLNRVAENKWDIPWEREKRLESNTDDSSDPLRVLTAKNQFEVYMNYSYMTNLGFINNDVKQAVTDALVKGKRNHKYTCFRSYQTENSEQIGGNWFFEKTDIDSTSYVYKITDEVEEKEIENSSSETEPEENLDNEVEITEDISTEDPIFTNPDPYGENDWDLLYLICAYDCSKNNLEGTVENSDGEPVSRYYDLLYGIGEYIIKAAYGVEVEVTNSRLEPYSYPVYEEETITCYLNEEIVEKKVYKKVDERTSIIEQTFPVYAPLTNLLVFKNEDNKYSNLEFSKELNKFIGTESETGENFELEFSLTDEYFEITDETEVLKPNEVIETEKIRVRGLQKSVLLSVLDLDPGSPYEVLKDIEGGSVTNSDYIEYSRFALLKILDISSEDFTLGSSSGSFITSNSQENWVWPIDPNGGNAFTITSKIGKRESPGGIGSTDHGGVDIGADYGVAILAAQNGRVEIANPYGGYGNCVRLDHGVGSDGCTYSTLYGHMSKIACSVGQTVKKGQVIGYIGSTGWSTGPHLHFEVRKNGTLINGLYMYDNSILNRLIYTS